ncbi:MAG: multifunctional CCA tRNA nucleotidyl transferase/2'3'-cyclic phosphodiesterase/2'nucleotidase/phosphatase, partial [Pseudomonadaceae bacterium]
AAQPLLRTLLECALDQQPLPVRWACLLAMLDDTAIEGLNAPRDCQELALLVGHFHDDASRAAELTSAELFELLQHLDIQRRPERFELFLQACVLLARGRGAAFPQADYLRGAAQAVRAVTVQPLIEQGYQGAELGEALKRTRLEAVARFTRARTECAASGRDA